VAVNAERDPYERIDASAEVPGTFQVIDALLFGTGARASQETLGLLSDTIQAWRRELRRVAPNGSEDPFAPNAQIHVINVNLRDAPDVMGRSYLLQIPTAFTVLPVDVDRLIEAGRSILTESPDFKALVKSLGGALKTENSPK
jgi:NTE family protein